jgi:hypothetical protein
MFRGLRVYRLGAAVPILSMCLLVAAPARAQDPPPVGTSGVSAAETAMMEAMIKASTPGPNHQMLASIAGEWNFKNRMWMNPSAPPVDSAGTATYTMLLGGRYLEGLYQGEMMGMPFEGRGLMGYDNVSRQFQATWADNMGTMIMLMNGVYDPSTKSITYKGEMDDLVKPGTKIKVRQVVRITSPDSHSMEWFETRDGKEVKTMEIAYSRKR